MCGGRAEVAGPLNRRIHEATSRALCRLAFVLLAALPLAVCLSWCALQFVPAVGRWQVQRQLAPVNAALGLSVHAERVQFLTPHRTVVRNVEIRHPETRMLIGSAAEIMIVRRRDQWSVQLQHVELHASQLNAAGARIHDWLLCQPQQSRATVVSANQLTIHDQVHGARSLEHVTAKLFPGLDETWLSLQAQLEAEDPGTAKVVVHRYHDPQRLVTRAQIRTQDTALPCWLVGLAWPDAKALGSQAQFSGTLDWEASQRGWQANVESSVTIDHFPLSSLFWTSADITGSGRLEIQRASISQAGVALLTGQLAVGPGRVGRQALEAARQPLGLTVDRSVISGSARDVGFDQAYCFFHIVPSSLHWVGSLSDARGNLAVRTEQQWQIPIPLSRVVNYLETAQRTGPDVDPPLGRLTRMAMRWLPLESESLVPDDGQSSLSSNP